MTAMCCCMIVICYFGRDFFAQSRPRTPGDYFMTVVALLSIFVAPIIATVYTARDLLERQKART
jgi:hypothetical protein